MRATEWAVNGLAGSSDHPSWLISVKPVRDCHRVGGPVQAPWSVYTECTRDRVGSSTLMNDVVQTRMTTAPQESGTDSHVLLFRVDERSG
jgi:hypothetical protein